MTIATIKAHLPERTFNKWIIVITVMLVAVIEVLDMTIVNVAMPEMIGSLSTNTDEITWILTSYIISSAIMMLLTGFLIARLGQKNLLLICTVGFLIASILCGLSQNIEQMIIFRTLQGMFGGSLVPLSQYIIRDTFSRKEQGMAMGIWAMGIMAAPVLGPTLGGYITEVFHWRFVFYINIPVCLLAFVMIQQNIQDTPTNKKPIDYIGLFAMIIGVASLQILLDRGNIVGWFESYSIIILTILSAFSLILFFMRAIQNPNTCVNLHVLANKNFAISSFLVLLFSLSVFGVMAIQPLMLEIIMGYSAITTGLLLAPRGIISALSMITTGALINRIDPRVLISLGLIISFYGAYLLSDITLQSSFASMMPALLVQGVGMGLFFVPISAIAYNTLKPEQVADASGLFSFSRSLGNSIGISILSSIISNQTQTNWQELGSHIQQNSVNLTYWLQHTHMELSNPKTIGILAKTLGKNAQFNAFIDAYWFSGVIIIIMLPLIFFLTHNKDSDVSLEHLH